MGTAAGTIAFVLHAHLPWVRHPAEDDALAARWLHATITGTCIPLLEILDALDRDRVPARLTLSLSPTLLGMLADPLLRDRYVVHLDRLVELAEKEMRRTRPDARIHRLAEMYFGRLVRARMLFLDGWQRDLISAFRTYQDAGLLEVITSPATSAVLPLLAASPAAVRAQLEVAAAEYGRFFAGTAEGLWLPGCAWEPGLDVEMARAGFRYFLVDTHGIAHATPRPVYGVYAPIACPTGVAAFGRDPDSTASLLGAEEGYPTDPWYLDVQRDIGFTLAHDDVRPLLPPDGRRVTTGLGYHRITGPTGEPAPYEPERARERVEAHARHFVEARQRQVAWLARTMDRPPIIVCAAEATLFGQAWFEGPQWLESVLRLLADTPGLSTGTPGDDLTRQPYVQCATPGASTSGWNGYAEAWLRPENDWVCRHLDAAARRLHALCRRYPGADARIRRALTQALRELFLAQSGDWPLLMSRPTTATYATCRVHDHVLRCLALCAEVDAGQIDDLRLAALEETDDVFPMLDYRAFL